MLENLIPEPDRIALKITGYLVVAAVLVGLGAFGMHKFDDAKIVKLQGDYALLAQTAQGYKASNDVLRASIDSYNAALEQMQKDNAARQAAAAAAVKKAQVDAKYYFDQANTIMGLKAPSGGDTCADAKNASAEFDAELVQERKVK